MVVLVCTASSRIVGSAPLRQTRGNRYDAVGERRDPEVK